MPLVKSGSIRRNLSRKLGEINKSQIKLRQEAKQKADNTRRKLQLNKINRAMDELYFSKTKSAGRTAPARKAEVKKILRKREIRLNGMGPISLYFGTPNEAANREMQRARSKTAAQLLKRRKQLRKLGWVKKPRV